MTSVTTETLVSLVEIGDDIRTILVLLNDRQADLSALTTDVTTNMVAAMNSLKINVDAAAAAAASAASIDDVADADTSVLSSNETVARIAAASAQVKADLIESAPGLLDSFNELAAAVGDNPNFASEILAALAKRVRFDGVQTLSSAEKTQAQVNMGVPSTGVTDGLNTRLTTAEADIDSLEADLGDVSTFDPLTTYTTARDA